MIKVYHIPPSRSFRVVWLMEELGEPYETERISFPFDAAFLARNPEGTLPFIEDDGISMAESIAILQYITGRRLPAAAALTVGPNPDPAAYAAHLQFLHLGEASLAAPLASVFSTRRFAPEDQKDNFTVTASANMFARRVGVVEKRLADGRTYIMGDTFKIADISIGFALDLAQLVALGDLIPEHTRAYHQRLRARAAYQRALAK